MFPFPHNRVPRHVTISKNAGSCLILCTGKQEAAPFFLAYTKNLTSLPQKPYLAAEHLHSEKDGWSFHASESGTENKNDCRILHVWISSCTFRV